MPQDAAFRVQPSRAFQTQGIHSTRWIYLVDTAGLTGFAAARNSVSVTRVYDLVMTHKLDADDFFIHRVQQRCAERRLNFFLVEPLWVEPFCDQFAKGRVWARVLLNMHSEHHLPDDI